MRRGARIAIAAGATAAAFALAPPVGAQVPVLHLEGRGFGHGVGLAQWGARYAADAGADAGTILATFYPGTELGEAGGAVRVAVFAGPDATLAFPQGGELRSPLVGDQSPGFPVAVPPGGAVTIRPADGGFTVEAVLVARSTSAPILTSASAEDDAQGCVPVLGPCPPPGTDNGDCLLGCVPTTTAPPGPTEPTPAEPTPTEPTPTEAPSTEPAPPPEVARPEPSTVLSAGPVFAVPAGDGVTDVVARARSYRGVVEVVGDAAGLRLVNQLDVETYLKGMAEVPASWPVAAQQAQAVAARTYVLRAMAASGEVCDHERCQVYVGATREAPAQSAAVDATRGVVLTYGGGLAATVYSAEAGGVTATATEGFGASSASYPYLTTVRYDTPDPLPWIVDVGLGDVGRRLGYSGTVTGVRVVELGPSGRAVTLALDGTAGQRLVEGRAFARSLGLRSTLFSVALSSAATAPSLPDAPALEEPMVLPDDVGALKAAIGATAEVVGKEAFPVSALRTAPPPEASGSPIESRPATLLALAVLGAATAAGMARAGGIDAIGTAIAGRRLVTRRRRPRSDRPWSSGAPRRGPRRSPR